jgi:methyl-accepting chemotaxis protein
VRKNIAASEVHTLSDIIKTAAEEINELASTSVSVAENADRMLTKLVPNIHKTAELVQEIRAASSVQAPNRSTRRFSS